MATALPHLASSLRGLSSSNPSPNAASTGLFAIDSSVLDGGYRYGGITSIAGSPSTEKTLLGYHAIASHLLTDTNDIENERGGRGREVALIDTTGGVSVAVLRDVLILRLRLRWRSRGRHAGERLGEVENKLGDEAIEMLKKVRFMRVFDLVGIMEAIGEMAGRKASDSEKKRCRKDREKKDEAKEEVGKEGEEEEEGVGEGGGGGDDEASERDANIEQSRSQDEETEDLAIEGRNRNAHDKVGMVIIDTITNFAISMVSRSPIQGQALLARCMRSLQHLTVQCSICTLLINSTVGDKPSMNPHHYLSADDHVSIFSSVLGRPALGKAFASWIDTSITLSMLPKTRVDAALAYEDTGNPRQKVILLEVSNDRQGTQEGRWVAITIVDGVKILPYFI